MYCLKPTSMYVEYDVIVEYNLILSSEHQYMLLTDWWLDDDRDYKLHITFRCRSKLDKTNIEQTEKDKQLICWTIIMFTISHNIYNVAWHDDVHNSVQYNFITYNIHHGGLAKL